MPGAAVHAGPGVVVAFGSRLVAGNHFRAAVVVEAVIPGLFDERFSGQEFSSGAVEQIIKSIAIRPGQRLGHFAAELGVEQDGDLRRIPVVQIVRRIIDPKEPT